MSSRLPPLPRSAAAGRHCRTAPFIAALASSAALWFALLVTGGCGPQQIDLPDAGAPPEARLRVIHGAETFEVSLGAVASETVNGIACVRASALVLEALPGTGLDAVRLVDVRAADGFSPTMKEDCAALLPLDGSALEAACVDPDTRNLSWDEGLGLPGCLFVRRQVAEIEVADR